MSNSNVLVLGVSGMLGSMVFKYLSENKSFKVFGTVRNPNYQEENVYLFDANDISQLERSEIEDLKIDYIINCIGITKPFCKDNDPEGVRRAININANFPWELANYAKQRGIKILTIGTDCVYSGKKGSYTEDDPHDPLDVYGKSKSLGEVFDGSTLIIRCSIIGPEMKKEKSFLLEWFLNQPNGSTIGGFAHHKWNGVTTLQFAQLCEKIITNKYFNKLIKISYVHHFIPNNTVNKYQLMNIFNELYEKNLQINFINKENQIVDRTLSTKYNTLSGLISSSTISSALEELKNYI
ncbi:MAG: dTDP-4-dehydrorhamnose reductase [Promethearchaeota archaeon]|nr:MAG: dTDP-4-dehydrorhamnose reductase [Candidatus Lokiarchaeota archaeon]